MTERYTLLAIDPSLAAPAAVLLDLSYAEPRLLGAWLVETQRAAEGKRKSVFDDQMRRGRYLRRWLAGLLREHRPRLIACEAMGGSQSAQAVAAMAIAQTVVACVVDEYLGDGKPIYITALDAGVAVGVSPIQRTKKGEPKKTSSQKSRDRKARKAAIARAVVARLGAAAWARALGVVDNREIDPEWEGAHDAAAVGLAAWELPEVGALRMIARQTTLADVGGGSMRAGDACP